MTAKKASRTRNLLERVERLCKLLFEGDMTISEIAAALCVTTSSVRSYLAHPRQRNLIDVVGAKTFGRGKVHEVLRLKRDEAAVAAMLKDLHEAKNITGLTKTIRSTNIKKVAQDKTRRVHTMENDAVYLPKVAPAAAPARHWMDQFLFGDGPARIKEAA